MTLRYTADIAFRVAALFSTSCWVAALVLCCLSFLVPFTTGRVSSADWRASFNLIQASLVSWGRTVFPSSYFSLLSKLSEVAANFRAWRSLLTPGCLLRCFSMKVITTTAWSYFCPWTFIGRPQMVLHPLTDVDHRELTTKWSIWLRGKWGCTFMYVASVSTRRLEACTHTL